MSNIMDRWMRESLNALEVMEAQRTEHEAAMEAAMDAIRRHSSAIERLEHDIAIVKEALDAASVEDRAEAATTMVLPTAAAPQVPSPAVAGPPLPPPLRPAVGGPRLVAP